MTPFFGRYKEMERLSALLKKKTSSLAVIRGRRRIGKSRLIAEFGKSMRMLTFSGLPPDDAVITAQIQRDEFARQMKNQLGITGLKADDWGDLFWHLSEHTKTGQVLLIFDEINWMGSKDPAFLGKLKIAWDLYFKNNPKMVLILSGSMSGWIEKNILSSTGFMGRLSLDLILEELPLNECNHFWGKYEKRISPYEKFKVLSVTGGVPRYLEEIDPSLTAEENIQNLTFQKGGLLFHEFDRIFSDLFSRKTESYKKLAQVLINGSQDLNTICHHLKIQKDAIQNL